MLLLFLLQGEQQAANSDYPANAADDVLQGRPPAHFLGQYQLQRFHFTGDGLGDQLSKLLLLCR